MENEIYRGDDVTDAQDVPYGDDTDADVGGAESADADVVDVDTDEPWYEDELAFTDEGEVLFPEETVRTEPVGSSGENVGAAPEGESEETVRTEPVGGSGENTVAAQNAMDVLHVIFPETRAFKKACELPNAERFTELLALGLSAKEAYCATHSEQIRERALSEGKRRALPSTKEHLRSNVPKGSASTGITMTKQELREWKEWFPDLSASEIQKLYARASK